MTRQTQALTRLEPGKNHEIATGRQSRQFPFVAIGQRHPGMVQIRDAPGRHHRRGLGHF